MKHAFKGLLYSGLVYPGLGHIALKRWVRGLPFLVAATIGLTAVIYRATRIALDIVASIDPMALTLDINQIFDTVNKALTSVRSDSFNLPVLILLLSWGLGMVDAFIIGLRMDRMENELPPLPDESVSENP